MFEQEQRDRTKAMIEADVLVATGRDGKHRTEGRFGFVCLPRNGDLLRVPSAGGIAKLRVVQIEHSAVPIPTRPLGIQEPRLVIVATYEGSDY